MYANFAMSNLNEHIAKRYGFLVSSVGRESESVHTIYSGNNILCLHFCLALLVILEGGKNSVFLLRIGSLADVLCGDDAAQ